jgi:hypothetical protein
MKIKLLSPLWGHEHFDIIIFLDKIRDVGFDGIDTWVPEDAATKSKLYNYLEKHEMHIVTHQHQANGKTFNDFKSSFKKYLELCAEPHPVLINSHTGHDYFSFEENLALIDVASEFSEKTGIVVAHETHRGRFGYSPQMLVPFFAARKDFDITADFSHWVCVTESMLQNFTPIVDDAILRSRHIHARIGFEEGPQVSHPAAPEWQYATNQFLRWWDRIIAANHERGCEFMPVTTEFGPQPYMPSMPFTNQPVADQFEVNCFMKDMLKQRYASFIS